MKPTLIVEGKVRKVSSINFFEATQPTALVETEEGYKVEDIASVADLISEGRYKPVIDDLNEHLGESAKYLQELKDKISTEVIAKSDFENLSEFQGADFLKTLRSLVDEYHEHKDYVDGVIGSIEIIKARAQKEEGNFGDE